MIKFMGNHKALTFIPSKGHMNNACGFISTSISPIITKLGRMVYEHALISPCRFVDVNITRLHDQNFPITIKLDRMVDLHVLILSCRSDNIITTKSYD